MFPILQLGCDVISLGTPAEFIWLTFHSTTPHAHHVSTTAVQSCTSALAPNPSASKIPPQPGSLSRIQTTTLRARSAIQALRLILGWRLRPFLPLGSPSHLLPRCRHNHGWNWRRVSIQSRGSPRVWTTTIQYHSSESGSVTGQGISR
jgi:hypothetical protein